MPLSALLLAAVVVASGLAGTATAQTADSPSAASIKSLQSRDAKEPARDAKDGRDLVKTTTAAAANPPKDAAVSTAVPRQRRPVLRCFQEGRLVFEGSGVMPSTNGQAAIELRNAGGTAIQVFDLKNGLCLLDYGNE